MFYDSSKLEKLIAQLVLDKLLKPQIYNQNRIRFLVKSLFDNDSSFIRIVFKVLTSKNNHFNKNICLKNTKQKTKVPQKIIVLGISGCLLLGIPQSAEGIGVPNSPISNRPFIERSASRSFSVENFLKIFDIYDGDSNKIVLTKSQIEKLDSVISLYRSGHLSAEQVALEMRGGSGWVDLISIGVFVIFVNTVLKDQVVVEGFVPPHLNPNSWTMVHSKPAPRHCQAAGPSSLKVIPPSSMPTDEFCGLTKEERRQLPHPSDMKIKREGRPELEVGFWQCRYKVGKHGAIHDLPFTLKKNGGTKTEKTDENALKMMQSIIDMANQSDVEWFENGTFQAGTNREFEAIHIYDPVKRVIVTFKKSTGKFVTTCQLTPEEDAELKASGNFGGGEGWFSGQVKNLPPEQTELNKVETEVTEINPISPIDENSSLGFTPTSSFESDVTGTTPINDSQLDKP